MTWQSVPSPFGSRSVSEAYNATVFVCDEACLLFGSLAVLHDPDCSTQCQTCNRREICYVRPVRRGGGVMSSQCIRSVLVRLAKFDGQPPLRVVIGWHSQCISACSNSQNIQWSGLMWNGRTGHFILGQNGKLAKKNYHILPQFQSQNLMSGCFALNETCSDTLRNDLIKSRNTRHIRLRRLKK